MPLFSNKPKKLSDLQLEELINVDFGTLLDQHGPAKLNSAVNAARELNSNAAPYQDKLAQLDRYSQFANFARDVPNFAHPIMLPIATGISAANEGSKMIPGAQNAIARLLGEKQFETNNTTSKPSLKNIFASARGYWDGATR